MKSGVSELGEMLSAMSDQLVQSTLSLQSSLTSSSAAVTTTTTDDDPQPTSTTSSTQTMDVVIVGEGEANGDRTSSTNER